MSIRLICGDGYEATLAKIFFKKMSLFDNRDIANLPSYVLRCKASSRTVNLLLSRIYDDNEIVKVTDSNIEELRSLCQELGFSGLDEEFRRFGVTEPEPPMNESLLLLKERVGECDLQIEEVQIALRTMWERTADLDLLESRLENLETLVYRRIKEASYVQDKVAKHDAILVDVQRQLGELMNQRGLLEESAGKVEALERQIDQVSRECLTQSSEAFVKLSRAIDECAKQVDVEKLARDVEQLKKNESEPEHTALCTCATSGTAYIAQKWYHCETCGLVDGMGCCEACAQTCHKGHVCVYAGVYPNCYCDCGVGSGPCQCQCMGELNGWRLTPVKVDGIEGIIGMLTRKLGGNLHDQGQVLVTSRDLDADIYLQKYVLDLGDKTSCYKSRNQRGAWFCLDFCQRRVLVSHYWVRMYGNSPEHLRTWVLEGSLEGNKWERIDAVDEASNPNYDYAIVQRNVAGVRGPFRYVRLRMTGTNLSGQWVLACSGIEFFGTLYEH